MSRIASERLAETFVELADTLVDDFDLIEFLQGLTGRTSELTGAPAVGLLMSDARDQLHFMAASDERIHLLELFQVQSDEGPCRDCYRLGHPVAVADLRRSGGRWPKFAPAALDAGFRSVHAFPLRLRKQVIGAMGLFDTDPSELAPDDVRITQSLADVATIGILQQRAIQHGEVLAGQLQGALDSRVVIEQAKGVVASRYGVGMDEAFRMLRTYCRNTHQRLNEVARSIVADGSRLPDLTAGCPGRPAGSGREGTEKGFEDVHAGVRLAMPPSSAYHRVPGSTAASA
jgi:hypothetical protein